MHATEMLRVQQAKRLSMAEDRSSDSSDSSDSEGHALSHLHFLLLLLVLGNGFVGVSGI